MPVAHIIKIKMSPDTIKYPLGEQNFPYLRTTYLESGSICNICSKIKLDDLNREHVCGLGQVA